MIYATVPPTTKGDSQHLLGIQCIYIDDRDTLWLVDAGRVIDLADAAKPMLESSPGGPKFVSIDLNTNKVTRTITFSSNVVFPASYLNDVRVDRSTSLSGISGNEGVAYLTDSSVEGQNGIVVVDVSKGTSCRHLSNANQTHLIPGTLPFVYGEPMYQITAFHKRRQQSLSALTASPLVLMEIPCTSQ